MALAPVGKGVSVKVLRDGKSKSLNVSIGSPNETTLSKSQKEKDEEVSGLGIKAPYNLGFAVNDYSAALAEEFHLPKLKQVHPVVVAVLSNGEAARAGIAPGDIVLDVNRREVTHAKDVIRLLRKGTINILRVLKQDRVVLVPLRASN